MFNSKRIAGMERVKYLLRRFRRISESQHRPVRHDHGQRRFISHAQPGGAVVVTRWPYEPAVSVDALLRSSIAADPNLRHKFPSRVRLK